MSTEKVFEIVRQQPVLPIEVASKLKLDSFIAKAFLDQLVEAGKINMTADKIAGIPVYFIAGQEVIADAKVKKLLEVKPAAKNFAASVPQGKVVEQKRLEFMARLKEIEDREQKLAEQKKLRQTKIEIPKREEVRPKIESKPAITEIKPVKVPEIKVPIPQSAIIEKPKPLPELLPRPVLATPASIVAPKEIIKMPVVSGQSSVVDASLAWLAEKGAEIISKELKRKGKEAIITASVPSGIGPMQFLVFALNKKAISAVDLSFAYSEGVQKKFPVIVASKGKLTKTAQAYLNSISGVVKFKQLE